MDGHYVATDPIKAAEARRYDCAISQTFAKSRYGNCFRSRNRRRSDSSPAMRPNMDEHTLATKMMTCSILNGYEGLQDLEQAAHHQPETTWRIAWFLICSKKDPGKDDGAMCYDLMRILALSMGTTVVVSHVLSNWHVLDHSTRWNIIQGFSSKQVITSDAICAVFESPSNTVKERHLILAMIAASRIDIAPRRIKEMASRIGSYDTVHEQDILNNFLASITQSDA